MIRKKLLMPLLVLFCLLPGHAGGSEPVQWNGTQDSIELEAHTQSWMDREGDAKLEDVMALDDSQWRQESAPSISHGYVDHPYWFRLTITNPTERNLAPYLEIGYPVLHHIEVHQLTDGQLTRSLRLGNMVPFTSRPVAHRNFVVPMTLAAGESLTLYLRVDTATSTQVPLTLWERSAFHAEAQSEMLFQGLYYGLILAMILYHCFVFIAVRERAFLYYIGYITSMPLFFASLDGLTYQYLWPHASWWNNHLMIIFLQSFSIFGCLFALTFLSIKRRSHALYYWCIQGTIAAGTVVAVTTLVSAYSVTILPAIGVAFTACVLMLFVGIARLLEGDMAARYYTLAWVVLLFGGITLALNKLALLPNNILTHNAVQVGSGLGVILLSIAIADRLNKEKQAALEAQQVALYEEKKSRLAQAETLKIQEEANLRLEERVRERTEMLEAANEQLREFSAIDSLTGLKNRGYFEENVRRYCAQAFRHQQPLSLLVMDIDYFKSFNDTRGHLVGDECLKVVAQRIADGISRGQDLVARFGGEEFVALLPDTNTEGARCTAERVRRAVAETPFQVSGEDITVTISIGVSSRTPGHSDISQTLFSEADRALYQAKDAGRNQVVVFQGTQHLANG